MATMVGIPARQTLVDADAYQRSFVPYGTPCSEVFDPATQKLELLQCEVTRLGKIIHELMTERDAKEHATRPASEEERGCA